MSISLAGEKIISYVQCDELARNILVKRQALIIHLGSHAAAAAAASLSVFPKLNMVNTRSPVSTANALHPAIAGEQLGVPAIAGVVRDLVPHVLPELEPGRVHADL